MMDDGPRLFVWIGWCAVGRKPLVLVCLPESGTPGLYKYQSLWYVRRTGLFILFPIVSLSYL
jgi:hypothetical protein